MKKAWVCSLLLLCLAGCTVSTPQGPQLSTGSVAVQHTVTLTWNASGPGVVGYNVYRGTFSSGPYTKINTALVATTNYVDNTVQAGTTYFYAVTSVDLNGMESAFSSQVMAIVPTP